MRVPIPFRSSRRLPATDPVGRFLRSGRRAHAALAVSDALLRERLEGIALPHRPEDWYLAQACDLGVPGAWERLAGQNRRPLRAFLRRRGGRTAEVDAVLDDLWGRLAAPPARGTATTRLGTYDGRGALFSWLATVAWRALADSWRARQGTSSGGDDGPDTTQRDPGRQVDADEIDQRLGQALEEAWGGLTLRELEAVVLKYRHHLPQTEIARVLGVGPPRVTRLLQSATQRLRAALETQFELRPLEVGESHALRHAVAQLLERAAVELPAQGDTSPARGEDDGRG
ncbi:MAG: sigma-70 family RNA polymerase sigma factor [Planctomycetes bacterium]|nr:sigma-70 family RNA polymerase sigma factor [Planctomycetota bacterium]MCB9902280.1 sigma-70 family RNA polymerase sigma factor [Planctomycetota bacterium]